jgi:hypothetical protein
MANLEDLDRALLDRLGAIGPEARAVLRHALTLPDLERLGTIGEFYADPRMCDAALTHGPTGVVG